jgi:Leucine-rich repeat (LRR) protein
VRRDAALVQIEYLPDSLTKLTTLVTLRVSGNRLRRLPDVCASTVRCVAPSLYFVLSGLQLACGGTVGVRVCVCVCVGMCVCLQNLGLCMPSLSELWIENNRLRRLPETLGSFTCLRLLVAYNNKASLPRPSILLLYAVARLAATRLPQPPIHPHCSL